MYVARLGRGRYGFPDSEGGGGRAKPARLSLVVVVVVVAAARDVFHFEARLVNPAYSNPPRLTASWGGEAR